MTGLTNLEKVSSPAVEPLNLSVEQRLPTVADIFSSQKFISQTVLQRMSQLLEIELRAREHTRDLL